MGIFTEEYRDLEIRVKRELESRIKQSPLCSKHFNGNVIKVNVFDYTELAIVNGELTFIDGKGFYHDLFADCYLEDLIDILESS
jgi:hypothetical protein